MISQTRPISHRRVAMIFALLANILWGTSFLSAQVALRVWGALPTTSLSFLIALLTLALVLPLSGHPIAWPRSRDAWLAVLTVGVSNFGIFYPLLYAGLARIPSSQSAAILLVAPLLVIGLAALFLREPLSARKLGAVALGVGGCLVLLYGAGAAGVGGAQISRPLSLSAGLGLHSFFTPAVAGGGLTLGAALSLATAVILTRRYAGAISMYNLTFWSIAVGAGLLLPFTLGDLLKQAAQVLRAPGAAVVPGGAILYTGIVCTAVCCFLWNEAIRLAPAREVAPTMYVKTPVAILLGVVWAQEPFTLPLALGTLLVALGVWVSGRER